LKIAASRPFGRAEERCFGTRYNRTFSTAFVEIHPR
jgi:hypothetical protein